MTQTIKEQLQAISMALRDAQREMVKAQESNNQEWQDECRVKQLGLMDAIETLKTVETLVGFFRKQAQS
jgi:hypothetical protein